MPDLNSLKVAFKKWIPVDCLCRICKVYVANVKFVWKLKLNLSYLDTLKKFYFINLNITLIYRSFYWSKLQRQPDNRVPYNNCSLIITGLYSGNTFLYLFSEAFKCYFGIIILTSNFFGSWRQLACLW